MKLAEFLSKFVQGSAKAKNLADANATIETQESVIAEMKKGLDALELKEEALAEEGGLENAISEKISTAVSDEFAALAGELNIEVSEDQDAKAAIVNHINTLSENANAESQASQDLLEARNQISELQSLKSTFEDAGLPVEAAEGKDLSATLKDSLEGKVIGRLASLGYDSIEDVPAKNHGDKPGEQADHPWSKIKLN